MSTDAAAAIAQWGAFLLCVAIGYGLSTQIKMPENPSVWLIVVAAIFLLGYLPLNLGLTVFGQPLPVGTLLWGLGVGLLLGFMLRRASERRRH